MIQELNRNKSYDFFFFTPVMLLMLSVVKISLLSQSTFHF